MTNDEYVAKGYTLYNLDDLVSPKHSGNYTVFVNQYWFVTHDRHVLRYKKMSFQTNIDIRVLEHLKNMYPNCTIELIPLVCVEM